MSRGENEYRPRFRPTTPRLTVPIDSYFRSMKIRYLSLTGFFHKMTDCIDNDDNIFFS